MRKGDRDRALANRGSHPLDVTAAHIPDRKHARPARFEQYGDRGNGQPAPANLWRESGPVLMKPLASSTRQPFSQSVFGTAPVITNT